MKLLSISSPLVGKTYWLEMPDGRVLKYLLSDIRLDTEYVRQHAVHVCRDRIGDIPENPDHATIAYANAPAIKTGVFAHDCWQTAKEDVLLRGLVAKEYVAPILAALTNITIIP